MRTRALMKKLYGEQVWENLKPWQKVLFTATLPIDILSGLVMVAVIILFILDNVLN